MNRLFQILTCSKPRTAFALLGAMIFAANQVHAQQVTVHRSSMDGDRLTQVGTAEFVTRVEGDKADIRIDGSIRHQKMLGFGASFNEAGMICLNSLAPAEQEKILSALFDAKKGAGFTAMKTVIGGTDFMSAGPFYTHNDTPGDVDMKHFSIERDLKPDGLVPYIKRSQKHGRFILQATMDYPPDWMLFDLEKNQDVNPKYFGALALYYLRYLEEYQKQGITIDYLSLFNEPTDVYTKIPFKKIGELIKNHVGPLFEKNGVKTRLQAAETVDRGKALLRFPELLEDPEVAKYISSIPYHGYDWRRKEMPSPANAYRANEFIPIIELARRYPELPLWMSEICHYNWGTPWVNPLPRYEFVDGDHWGHQLFQDIAAGASAWTYWNMILDEQGGPWLISKVHGDPEINHQQPVVIVNRRTKEVTYTGLYYYLAHFSKFVRPGAVRIGAQGRITDVRSLAFEGPDGKMVVQLMNSGTATTPVQVSWQGKSFEVKLPRYSITTCEWVPEPGSKESRKAAGE
jgi:glucosylceramidase